MTTWRLANVLATAQQELPLVQTQWTPDTRELNHGPMNTRRVVVYPMSESLWENKEGF